MSGSQDELRQEAEACKADSELHPQVHHPWTKMPHIRRQPHPCGREVECRM